MVTDNDEPKNTSQKTCCDEDNKLVEAKVIPLHSNDGHDRRKGKLRRIKTWLLTILNAVRIPKKKL
jgi:hypothetical protein